MTNREIDILVAEKVMGLVVCDCISNGVHTIHPMGKTEYYKNVSHYSTDISAAWEAVEKIGNLHTLWNHEKDNQYCCSFIIKDDYFEAMAETAPKAICLAALKVVGEEICCE